MNGVCPYCKQDYSRVIDLRQEEQIRDGGFQVACNRCGARGPWAGSAVAAMASWQMPNGVSR